MMNNLGDMCLSLEEKASLFTVWSNKYSIFFCCKVQAGLSSIMDDLGFLTLGFLFYPVIHWYAKVTRPHGVTLRELGHRKPKQNEDNVAVATPVITCPFSFT